MKNRIAVAIPTFNREEFIVKALFSLKNQVYKSFDIHIFDNCSDDKTVDLVKQYTDERVFLHVSNSNVGFVGNMNNCLSLSEEYDWVGILHSDDYHIGESVALVDKVIDRYPNCGLIFSEVNIVSLENKISKSADITNGDKVYSKGLDALNKSLQSIPCSTTFYNSRAIKFVGKYDFEFPFSADEEFNNRVASNFDIVCVGKPIAHHLIHDKNLRNETWIDPMFIENYALMRRKMLSKTSLPNEQLEKVFKKHMSSSCLAIATTLARNNYKAESLKYNKLAWKYSTTNLLSFINLSRSLLVIYPKIYILLRTFYFSNNKSTA